MFFNVKAILASAILISGFASGRVLVAREGFDPKTADGGRCDRPYMKRTTLVGGPTGTSFCTQKSDFGAFVKGLDVWGNGEGLKGLRFYFTDGKISPMLGGSIGDKQEWRWEPENGDLINRITLWGHGLGRHLGRIEMSIEGKQTFKAGKEPGKIKSYETTDTGSGIMVGGMGLFEEGKWINQLAFAMLKSPIKTMELKDVKYEQTVEELQKQRKGITDRILLDKHFENNHKDVTVTYNFESRWSLMDKHMWSTTQTHTLGAKHSWEASGQVLGMGVKETTELNYEYQNAQMEGDEKSQDIITVDGGKFDLKPGEEMYCRAIVQRGEFKGAFTTTVVLHLEDQSTWQFDSKGDSDVIKYSDAKTECQSDPFTVSNNLDRVPGGEANKEYEAQDPSV
ncbi:unnamed protein product [Periconia digitata]|uniref:Jacalin-type lectin domain-containing protein n=1 Tax=Periconia digitata TaxID=1303443 RepID=A0A9W4UN22_9PLEO|nr:unnamed protein product [Periconia digitata]